MTGTIARLVSDKGFGFIKGDDGVDRFFHRSAAKSPGFEDLREHQRVTFDHVDAPKGARAENIRAS